MRNDFIYVSASGLIGDVLQAYIDHKAQYWWLLIAAKNQQYYVCSFGSLLPYLTGRTDHIVHSIGDCVICSGLDPLLWQNTDRLIEEALASQTIRSRLVAELPLANIRETAVSLFWQDGNLIGIDYPQIKSGLLPDMPSF